MDYLLHESNALTERLWGIFDNLWPALLLLVIGWMVVRYVKVLAVRGMSRKLDMTAAQFMGQILHAMLLAILFIAVLGQLGVNTTSLLAALGALGLAVGLALKDSIQNLASGILLVALHPFNKGDYIEGAGTAGSVEKLTLLHTYLKTPDNRRVMIPNSALTGANLVNYSSEPQRRLDILVGVSYDDDVRQVKALLLKLVSEDERALQDPAPLVAIMDFGDSSVDLSLRVWVKTEDFWGLRWDLMERIKLAFDEAGITIPYPQRDVHHYQHSSTAS
ncbi:mechanosensitive ion channel family protein [Marinospirillum alkaliphilum]|uniref:Small-conductance mechanosensitive channel n=1 Tax=Marinospirillum alkaliphilum DSM 21637 TaxID=1122209 RepID=A0A1K1WA57_9GAMM|nr:mechanosensitive ion channel domain-containing protein [Marinospirillum alkaliphilum]SFX34035.1 small conductance mechanosensitive channel [Marinospirillum alkaliphilum DSM 21637]